MDQNLEPKGDMPQPEIKMKRLSPEQSGVYFLGESSPRSFVGYIKNGWSEQQIQQYIDVQKRLAPKSLKEREPRSETPVENTSTSTSTIAEGWSSQAGRTLETIVEADEGTDTNAGASPSKWARMLETVPETDEEE